MPLSIRQPRWWPKSCEHCGGDLHEERLMDGIQVQCFQCGRIHRGVIPERLEQLDLPKWLTEEREPDGGRRFRDAS